MSRDAASRRDERATEVTFTLADGTDIRASSLADLEPALLDRWQSVEEIRFDWPSDAHLTWVVGL